MCATYLYKHKNLYITFENYSSFMFARHKDNFWKYEKSVLTLGNCGV